MTEPRIDPAQLASISPPTRVVVGNRDLTGPEHGLLIDASTIAPSGSPGLLAEQPELINRAIGHVLL